MATPKEILRIGGREVAISNPDKVYFPETGYTKLDLVQYYLAVADGALRGAGGRPMALKRFVDGAAGEAFFQKRAPDNPPRLDPHRRADLPVGPDRRRDRPRRAGRARVGRQPRLHRPQPAPGPGRGPRPPRRAAGRPRPGPGRRRGRRSARSRSAAARRSRRSGWSAGPRRPGRAGSTSTSGSSRAGRTPRSAAPRWRWPATSSAACPDSPRRNGGRRSATASSSTTTRTPRTGRSPSAYSVRPLAGRAGLDAAALGRGPDRRGRGVHARDRAGTLRGGRRPGCRDRRGRRVAGGAPRAERPARGRGAGDAPWPPNYAKQAGEPPRVQPSTGPPAEDRVRAGPGRGAGRRRRSRPSAPPRSPPATRMPGSRPSGPARVRRRPAGARRRSRSSRSAGPPRRTRRSRGSIAGRNAIRRSAALEPADVLVDGMRGRSSLWYRVRVNLIHVPEAHARPRRRSTPTTTRGPAWT